MSFEPGSPLPPLRQDIEVIPYEHEGKPVFLLSDPEADSDRALALSPAGMAVASLLDGARTGEQIAADLSREMGALLTAATILGVVKQLDAAGLLETESAHARRRARLDDFLKAATRKAMFQGRGGYPSAPLELAAFIGGFFRHAKGPGRPLPETPSQPQAVGLVSPHIDLNRGGPAYAWAYGALADTPAPDVIVALGVAHASPNSPWAFTRKAYETPYGPMTVAEDLYKEIAESLWYNPLDDEWVHRREHSLEFQALWLRYLWRERAPSWVPILCSSFERFAEDRPPSTVPTVEQAIKAVGEILAKRAKRQRVLVLAGVDLAHVGPRFGDEIELSPEVEKKIEAEDRLSLDRALALDADGFYASVVKDGHWRKVCGLSALYTSVRLISAISGGQARGRLLAYDQAADPAGGVVSFASALYTAN
jgi:MEMO1 family protein